MKTVLAVVPQRGRQDRVRVFLDEGPSLSLTRLTAAEWAITEGRTLSDGDLREIIALDTRRSALDTALTFLSYRPRSAAEVRGRLRRARFSQAVVQETLERLREQGLVDDASFAEFWVENREAYHPRSRRLLRQELRGKGVDQEVAGEAVAEVDEEAGAYRLARKRGALLNKLEYPEFRRRLGGFLQRHGYPYAVCARTVARVWEELHGEAPEEDELTGLGENVIEPIE
ncbi:MAG: RecX family transcriptional regulator [Chloroflexi bacterium]|nr:RecX family transcriptional regulator [Chloroflexota bacterium]